MNILRSETETETETMEDAKYLDLMAKYLSGNITRPEREALLTWVESSAANRMFFDEMIQLWSISSEYEQTPFSADVHRAWERLEARLPEAAGRPAAPAGAPSAKIIRLSNQSRWVRAAAVLLLLVLAGLGLWVDPLGWRLSEVRTLAGERREVVLPDGSEVWLNEHTTLSYRRSFRQRKVRLSGEAFFDVQRDERRPFAIISGEARTVVLGTAFNVRAYPGEERIEVTVQEGRVRLEDRTSPREEVTLDAGRTGVLDRQTQQVREVEQGAINADAWKTRTLRFDNLPLREVIPALERYYGITFRVEDETVFNCPFFGTWPEPDRKDMLKALDYALVDASIEEVNDSTFLITGMGCERMME